MSWCCWLFYYLPSNVLNPHEFIDTTKIRNILKYFLLEVWFKQNVLPFLQYLANKLKGSLHTIQIKFSKPPDQNKSSLVEDIWQKSTSLMPSYPELAEAENEFHSQCCQTHNKQSLSVSGVAFNLIEVCFWFYCYATELVEMLWTARFLFYAKSAMQCKCSFTLTGITLWPPGQYCIGPPFAAKKALTTQSIQVQVHTWHQQVSSRSFTASPVNQWSPTPGPWAGTVPWTIWYWATKKEYSSFFVATIENPFVVFSIVVFQVFSFEKLPHPPVLHLTPGCSVLC